MYLIFHKSTNSKHEGCLAERLIVTLIVTMDELGLEINPYEEGNPKHAIWIYIIVGCQVSTRSFTAMR